MTISCGACDGVATLWVRPGGERAGCPSTSLWLRRLSLMVRRGAKDTPDAVYGK